MICILNIGKLSVLLECKERTTLNLHCHSCHRSSYEVVIRLKMLLIKSSYACSVHYCYESMFETKIEFLFMVSITLERKILYSTFVPQSLTKSQGKAVISIWLILPLYVRFKPEFMNCVPQ